MEVNDLGATISGTMIGIGTVRSRSTDLEI